MAGLLMLPFVTLAGGNAKNVSAYRLPAGVTSKDYMAKTIILRVQPQYRSLCAEQQIQSATFSKAIATLGTVHLQKMFPNHLPPATEKNERGETLVDLSLIYELHYSADAVLEKTINSLLATGLFLYAEPKFIPTPQYNPNDPGTSLQYFLTRINAYTAWDIHKGDTATVIGITDTGTDMDHPDLEPNIKRNWADPVDGIDNDGNGFTDDFMGWDLGENDNTPAVNVNGHGSHVSGCAAAVTDNGTGVASPGFRCKFLPVKIADATGALTKAYEGIVYAADRGCQVINCSWGGGGAGSFGQNVIDYATINRNSLVIAGAGNNSSMDEFYPAAYDKVISVAATGVNDVKSNFSNFGYYIDVCAPGSNIYSAQWDDTYAQQSGTSMASPVAAGCAAIIKSYHPTWTALQVGEQLRITCDNIYSLGGNGFYPDMLGNGRVNLLEALSYSGPAVRMEHIAITDNNDDILLTNDTMRITADFTNYLQPTTNLIVTVSTTSGSVSIIDGTTTIGVLGTMATVNNTADPFVIKINPTAPQNETILLKFTLSDGSYNDFQVLEVTINVDYLNITINDVHTTNTSKGRICYNGVSQADGLGFNFLNDGTLAYETGFMVGVNGNVSDNVRGAVVGATDEDFSPVVTVQKHEPGIWSDFDTYGKFNDAANATAPLGLLMEYRSFSFANAPDARYHIFEYKIKNTSGVTRNNVYAGIFSDWDIQTYANNKAAEDAGLKMGYAWCTDAAGYYAGTKLLTSSGGFRHYAVDNITGGGGGADLSNGYDDSEKYQTLSTNRPTAGGTGTGNDVIDVVSTGPFTIAPGDSVTVAFALLAGVELGDLQGSAAAAQIKYDLLTGLEEQNTSGIINAGAWPNPAAGTVTLPFLLKESSAVTLSLFDLTGRLMDEKTMGQLPAGEHSFKIDLQEYAGGLYIYRLSNDKGFVTGNIVKE